MPPARSAGPTRTASRALAFVAASVVVAACGGGGTTGGSGVPSATGPPSPSAVASPSTAGSPTRGTSATGTATATGAAPTETAMAFTLTSTAFTDGGQIPKKFSCDGDDVSPGLTWQDAPDDTASFVLIVDDPDANGFVHWLVFNMTGSQSGGLPEAVSAGHDGPPQGTNSFGRIGWGGPCPPSGTHRYRFTLLALDTMLELAGAPKADEVRAAAEGHVLEQATLEATYTRGG